jgi:lysyl-tRNA synthetase class 2
MLEWYRPGYDLSDLMLEVAALVEEVLQIGDFRHLSYRQLFEHYLGLNPHQADEAELAAIARARLDIQAGHMSRADWLDVLMSHLIEPQLSDAVFVYDFPMQQASLSRIARNTEGDEVARRFELYIGGMEIANGYDELLDAAQLQQRFETDNVQRQLLGLPAVPVDQRLLAAHRHGLPACAGVALGVDRLLMLKCGVATIDQVLAFSDDRI